MNPGYLSSVHHDGSARYVRPHRESELRIGDEVTLRLRTVPDAPIERLLLRTCPDGEQFFAEMHPASSQPDSACRWWEVNLQLHMPVTAYRYGEPKHVESRVPWTTEALAATWQTSRAAIPWVIARQQFNLLGSHDTARILHAVNGDAARNRLAAAFLLTYVGVPCVYYGDEIGMQAGDALGARDPMIWDIECWDADLRVFYQTLIRLRLTSSALIEGGFQILSCEENTLAFLRDTDAEQILVIGNRGPGERPGGGLPLGVRDGGIPDGTLFCEVFTGQTLTVQGGYLSLPAIPVGVQIWQSVGM